MKFGDIHWAQHDGTPPSILTTTAPRGESGISLLRMRFSHSAYISGSAHQHLVLLQMSPRLRIRCQMSGRPLVHEPRAGTVVICPAGIDGSAEANTDVDALLLAVSPGRLRLAAAEDGASQVQLQERLSGYDTKLLAIAKRLADKYTYRSSSSSSVGSSSLVDTSASTSGARSKSTRATPATATATATMRTKATTSSAPRAPLPLARPLGRLILGHELRQVDRIIVERHHRRIAGGLGS